jgi:hypothetical protein
MEHFMTAARHLLAASLVLGAVACYGEQAAAQTYDAFKQFSIKDNPSETWSYIAAGQKLATKLTICDGIKKLYCWTNGGASFPNVAAEEANKTGATVQNAGVTLPASYLDLDPQGIASVGLQWTAPAAADIHVTGNFLGVASDEGSHNVAVLYNGTPLVTYTISHFQQKETFRLHLSVAAGDTIAFMSYSSNGGGALSTGLQAKIAAE